MELGSEFSLEDFRDPCEDNIDHFLREFETLYVDSGRSALKLLAGLLPPGKILLPSYICESVYTCFPADCVRFYQLTQNLQIDWDSLFQQIGEDTSVVYLHYFNGVLPGEAMLQELQRAREKQNFQIVEDTTHSIFSAPLTIGDYGVCSLRKWFPIPDGGVLYGQSLNGLAAGGEAPWVRKKVRAMGWKQMYLSGRREQSRKAEYRQLFAVCDCALDVQRECYGMSEVSRKILAGCSISQMLSARKRNTAQMKKAVTEEFPWLQPLAWTRENECPLTFPVKVRKRDALRAYLISKEIYCAVHWPLQGTPMESAGTASVSGQELSLPIDQRYHADEMEYLLNCLRCYGREAYAETD